MLVVKMRAELKPVCQSAVLQSIHTLGHFSLSGLRVLSVCVYVCVCVCVCLCLCVSLCVSTGVCCRMQAQRSSVSPA